MKRDRMRRGEGGCQLIEGTKGSVGDENNMVGDEDELDRRVKEE